MSIRHLGDLFHPSSIALVGASGGPATLGHAVLTNVLAGGFAGPVFAVNPHPIDMPGISWVPSVQAIPSAPDIAVIMIPAPLVPDCVRALGKAGTRIVVVISAGFDAASGLRDALLGAAGEYGVRIIGPNCLGLLLPHVGLNASFAHLAPLPGRLALISQSGALITSLLDWAGPREIGFSGIISAGDMADADVGDYIDLFATDARTDAILLYIEGITDAAKFMSAARAAARSKPVIAIKAGRTQQARNAARSHSGALAGSYDVYAAAFARAGIVQVETLSELFDAAAILGEKLRLGGDRVAILTNGGGAGVLAADDLAGAGLSLANLEAATLERLDADLPPSWSHANPVDVLGDAGAERYGPAIQALAEDPGVDAILAMNCPTALVSSTAAAKAVADSASACPDKPVLACWLGDANAAQAAPIFRRAAIPLFSTPEDAARAIGYLRKANLARIALVEAAVPRRRLVPDRAAALTIIAAARAEGRTLLNEVEAKSLLSAYGVAVVPTRFASSPAAIELICQGLDAPYAVKIVSPDIVHKSDAGGVALSLATPAAAAAAARAMEKRIRSARPKARIHGYAIQPMCIRPQAIELLVGVADDPTFGPVMIFGAGGKAVEVIADKALMLPPLSSEQAQAMISRTRVARLLAGYRDQPPANMDAIADTLVALSDLLSDIPEICELDINPLLADSEGAIALDARIGLSAERVARSRMTVRPVPLAWTTDATTRSGAKVHIRPVIPADEPALAEFFTHVTPDDLRFRFLSSVGIVSREQLKAMTNIDYRRSISFIVTDETDTVVATALLAADPDRSRAEIALSTRADWKARGVSYVLMQHLLDYAQAERIGTIEAVELAEHSEALRMEKEMGFTSLVCPEDPSLRIVRRNLDPEATARRR